MEPSSPSWLKRLDSLFDQALDLPAAERDAFLDRVATEDPRLGRELAALLRDAERDDDLLESPAAELAAGLLADAASRDTERLPDETAPDPLERGVLGPYRLIRRLGRGGMGDVLLAEDPRLGRQVAIKLLPPEMAEQRERLRRFQREARTLAALNHPNIVTLHSLEEADGLSFITLEYVAGETLDQAIPDGGLDRDGFFRLAVPLAAAVAAAHARGVVHRDLKPNNVMLSTDGQLKVLDFGIAKLVATADGAAPETTRLTRDGGVLGTLAYMAPEQLAGEAVDARADVFALGVLLYEMATGEHPFVAARGDNANAKVISSILRRKPAPIDATRRDLPRELPTIIERCLEKEPQQRYASAAELLAELERARRGDPARATATEHDSGAREPLRTVTPRAAVWGVVLAVILTVLGVWWMTTRNRATPADAADSAETSALATSTLAASALAASALAVLEFRNLTGDPTLDWLSAGIPEMLVTDLAQSAELELVSTAKLRELVAELGLEAAQELSSSAIRALAERADVRAVVRGNYARVSELIRVSFSLEEAASGAILDSGGFEGRGEESLFTLVDELSAAIRNRFESAPATERPGSVEEVTTSSLEAWRLYSEAVLLHERSERAAAVALLEKALELDADFALAAAKLGRLQSNLGRPDEAARHTRRAVELAERLPLDQRYQIEGNFYAGSWSTLDQAITAFSEGVRLFPQRERLRNNLAKAYADLERYEEAAREYRWLVDRGTSFPGTYTSLANVYAGLGRFESGYRVLADFLAARPDNWVGQVGMGWFLTEWGRLDDALEHFRRAAELRPGEVFVPYGRWRVEILRDDFAAAEREVDAMLAIDDPFARWRGAVSRARIALYRDDDARALEHFADAATAFPPGAFTALVHAWEAEVHLAQGEAELALATARLAQVEGRDEWPERLGIFFAALAEQDLGRDDEARRLAAELRGRADESGYRVEERLALRLEARLALADGDTVGAIATLERAVALLPAQGVEVHWHVYPDHVGLWHDLGQAHLAAGHPEKALALFEQAASSGAEHLESPLPYRASRYRTSRRQLDRVRAGY